VPTSGAATAGFPQNVRFGIVARKGCGAETALESMASRLPASRRSKTIVKEKTKLSALSAEFNNMKAVSKLVVLLIVGVFVSGIASAKSDEQAYLESCVKAPGIPVPIAVVSPAVGPEYNGAIVQLEFVVDGAGKPVDLAVKSTPDDRLAATVLDAVKQWRFKPAERDGVPVETKVSLPVRIVESPADVRFASR
jgi:protein TonB